MKTDSNSNYRGDLMIGAVILIAVWALGVYFDLFELIHEFLQAFEHWQLDEILMAMLVLSLIASWFSYRRWQEAVGESARAKQSESDLNEAQAIANVGSWQWNLLDDSNQWSDQLYVIYGLDKRKSSADAETFLNLVHPSDKQLVLDAVEEAKISGVYDCEYRIVRPDHSIGYVHSLAKVHCNAAGDAIAMSGTAIDLTSRKQIDLALRESELHLQSILDNTTTVIYLKDLKGKYILVNKQWGRLFNVTAEWMVGKTDHDVFPAEIANAFQENDRRVITENNVLEIEEFAPHDDGMHTYISIKFPLTDESGSVYGVGGISTDITERKLAEIEVRESRERFSGIVEMAADGIISINEEQQITLFNRAAEQMFGIAADEIIGEHIEKLIPVRFHASHRERVDGFNHENEPTLLHRRAGMVGQRINGEEFPIETSISKQMIGDKTIMTVMIRDLADQLKAEAMQRKLLMAIGEAGEAIMITDCNAVIEYVNPAFTEITGYAAEEAIGNDPSMLKSDAQDPKYYLEMWNTISAGQVWHGTMIDRRKDGSFYPALMSVAPIHDESGEITHYVSLQQDMTEYKKLEEQFLQAQKMEAIGTLVGGIAHDFNNMLAAMQGNIFLARRKVDDVAVVAGKLEKMDALSHRAAEVVSQLLTFARKGRVDMHLLPLNAFIREGLKLAKSAIPENITLIQDICDERLQVKADATQLQQLLMNLLNNARDAVEAVEHAEIKTSLVAYHPTAAFYDKHPDIAAARLACLTVEDNGCGISALLIDKVVEPFFTTKAVGKGTGLGLAMVYGAVHTHGGALEIDSKPDQGTAIRIYLPVVLERRQQVRAPEKAAIAGHNEVVLLVDDDVMLLATVSEVLKSLGYQVVEAVNGEAGLDYYRDHQDEIALVISDIVMPKLGGIEMLQKIREMGSQVPVILMTGYDFSGRSQEIKQYGDCDLLSKPVSISNLSNLIRKALHTK